MPPIVSIESLQRYAIDYDTVLRTLPHVTLEEIYQTLRLTVLEVANSHKRVTFERTGNILKPYSGNVTEQNEEEIGKIKEMELKVETAYFSIWDNILNYKSVKAVSNAGEKVNNQSKKHPMEKIIIDAIIKTWAEDIIYSMYAAERDTSNMSPLGAFDGYDTLVTKFIASGDISAGKGNLINSGSITAPTTTSDVTALNAIVDWFGKLHPQLTRQGVLWYVNDAVLGPVMKALDNKHQSRKVVDYNDLIQYLKVYASVPKLEIINDPCLGTGQRFYATVKGNMDFGLNTQSDNKFVQIIQDIKDPNRFHAWIQAEIGCRWNHINPKMFACNEQAFVPVDLSGDYKTES